MKIARNTISRSLSPKTVFVGKRSARPSWTVPIHVQHLITQIKERVWANSAYKIVDVTKRGFKAQHADGKVIIFNCDLFKGRNWATIKIRFFKEDENMMDLDRIKADFFGEMTPIGIQLTFPQGKCEVFMYHCLDDQAFPQSNGQ